MQSARTLTAEIGQNEEKEITLMGWVAVRRDHGKIIFIDLRDRSGMAQIVFKKTENDDALYARANALRPEWVISITGIVTKRRDDLINKETPNGEWEIKASALEVLNDAQTPAISIDTDGYETNEESRLKYRYLDLRRPRMQKNIIARHETISFMRDYLNEQGFIEVETPILTKSTPEGARDYLVPSRIYPGSCYALPQSPQQYKQLLMIAGLERYYQFARCFRDEDTRGDRQPEFTQLDLEMSFVSQENIMALIESLYTAAVETLFPEKKIAQKPFPRLTYANAMKEYGTDRPDLRKNKNNSDELAFAWIVDFPFFEEVSPNTFTFTHNPFSAPKKEWHASLLKKENIKSIIAAQHDLALNGFEIGGGGIRSHTPDMLKTIFEIIGYGEERIKENFSHMLEALASGAPPHGGIAMGIDRFLAIILNEPNIREAIAFPKTGDARDLMMDAPSRVDIKQLNELGLELIKNPGKKWLKQNSTKSGHS